MNWLDITVLIFSIVAVLTGIKTGLIMQVASLLGVILGVIFARNVAVWIHPHINGLLGDSSDTIGVGTYIIAFLLILIAANLIGVLVNLLAKIVLLGLVNRIGGGVFSLIACAIVMSIVLTIVVKYDKDQLIIKKEVREKSQTYPILLKIGEPIIPLLDFEKTKIPTLPSKETIQSFEISI